MLYIDAIFCYDKDNKHLQAFHIMSADPKITIGDRAYVAGNVDSFGQFTRPSFLGLKNAPVLQMDDGTLVGVAGQNALTQVVPVSTGKNFNDEAVTLPLDVKTVGTETLTGMNIPADKQTAMFTAFQQLPKEEREALAGQWTAVSAGSDADKKAFVDKMIATLAA